MTTNDQSQPRQPPEVDLTGDERQLIAKAADLPPFMVNAYRCGMLRPPFAQRVDAALDKLGLEHLQRPQQVRPRKVYPVMDGLREIVHSTTAEQLQFTSPEEQLKLFVAIKARQEREERENTPGRREFRAWLAKIRSDSATRWAAEREAEQRAAAERHQKALAQRDDTPDGYQYYVAGYLAACEGRDDHREAYQGLVQPAVAHLEALGVPSDYYLGPFDDEDEEETAYFRRAVEYLNKGTPKLPVSDATAKRVLDWMRRKQIASVTTRMLHDSMRLDGTEALTALQELRRTGHLVVVEGEYRAW